MTGAERGDEAIDPQSLNSTALVFNELNHDSFRDLVSTTLEDDRVALIAELDDTARRE